MASRGAKASAQLSYMVDSASEDEFQQSDADVLLTPDSAVENNPPAKRKPGRPKAVANASKVTKARAPSRRVSGGSVAAGRKPAPGKKTVVKRAALAERPNPSDTEEVDDFEQVQEVAKPAKRPGRPRADDSVLDGRPKKTSKSSAPRDAPSSAIRNNAAPKQPRGARRAASVEPTVIKEEIHIDPDEDISQSIEIDEMVGYIDSLPAPQEAPRQYSRGPSASRQRQPAMHRRAGSASDNDRAGSDPMLRRKLGDTTKKLESLNIKYSNLREVGMQDKETNFERLKRATDQREQDQNNVIASLKRQLAEQQKLNGEAKAMRERMHTLEAENKRLAAENKTLNASLHNAQNEAKSLSTKLAASRSSVQAQDPKAPGSAVKPRTVLVGSADAQKEAQVRQLKEDLYSDLTGLIIRGVKKVDSEDVYDCIQTGRNGTLHFHLSVLNEDPGKAGSATYEDVEFAYTPLLDANRDRDILDILPEYLTEEICFPRSNAAKFYSKVVDCMTKKIEIVDDDE